MRARERSPMLRGALALALLAGLAVGRVRADDVVPAAGAHKDGKADIQQVGCSNCAGGLLGGPPLIGGHSGGGCGSRCGDNGPCGPGQCYAGKEPCDCGAGCGDACGKGGFFGTFMGIYQCICCNDPCYEPRWYSLANSAFLVDSVRPVTQMRLGVDWGRDLRKPDKSELFWARANQKGPRANAGNLGPNSLDYSRAYMVNEASVGGVFSIAIETNILAHDPDGNFNNSSGFGDMAITTKNMVLDCELLQVAFQFRTVLPTGNFTKGIGTGHTSLEPSLIAALKLTPHSYLQGQLGYRFPIGGTDGFQGSLVFGRLSYNHLLWNCGHDIELIGNIEGDLSCSTNGLYTDPVTGGLLRTNTLGAFFNIGPGIRLVLCKKVDFGVAASVAVTDETVLGNLLRAEFRWRF